MSKEDKKYPHYPPASDVEFIPKPENFKPVKDWDEGHPWHGTGRTRCQAWNPRQGRQCELQASTKKGFDKCHKHGGKSKVGMDHPRTTSGKYSKWLPTGILGKYEQARTDPNILGMNEEIALIDGRIFQLLESLGEGAGSSVIKGMAASMRSFDRANQRAQIALSAGDESERRRALAEAANHLNELRERIFSANKEFSIWDDITRLWEMRRRMTETERKLEIDKEKLLRVDFVFMMVDRLLSAVLANVQDPESLQAIQSEFNSLPIGQIIDGNLSE